MARDDLDGDLASLDAAHLAFEHVVLAKDEPVCNQDPPEIPLDPGVELSARTDKVSIAIVGWTTQSDPIDNLQ